MEVGGGEMAEDVEIAACLIARHGEVLEEVVAAVAGSSAGDVTRVGGNELEGALHEGYDVLTREVAAQEEIVAGEAAHGSPIDDAVFPFGVIAEIGSGKVLEGVERALPECGLAVGCLHADVECGDGLSADLVLAADVDAGEELQVVDLETGYFVHSCVVYVK